MTITRTDDPLTERIELGDYLRVLSGRWPLVLLVALVLGSLGLVGVQFLPTNVRYVSTTQVLPELQSIGNSDLSARIDELMATEVTLAESAATIDLARERFDFEVDRDVILARSAASRVDESSVVEVRYVAATAELARQGADALADAYLDVRRRELTAVADQRAALAAREVEALEAQLREHVIDEVAAVEGSVNEIEAQVLRDMVASQLGRVRTELSLDAIDPTDVGAVIARAEPGLEVGSEFREVAPFGVLLLAALGAIAAAFLAERFDPRVRSALDVAETLGAPVLAEVSKVASGGRITPTLAVDESIRQLRAVVQARLREQDLDVLLVTTATVRSRRSDVGLRLAIGLAELQDPVYFARLGSVRDEGLELARLDHKALPIGLDILPSDATAPLTDAWRQASTNGDGGPVIVDGESVLVHDVALRLAKYSGGLLVAVHRHSARRKDLGRLRQLADQVAVPVVGAVLEEGQRQRGLLGRR